MKKQTKIEKAIDKRIERAYYATCSGIPINVMDISKVFKHGAAQVAAGATDLELQISLLDFVRGIAVKA